MEKRLDGRFRDLDYSPQPASSVETAFRHRGWRSDRIRVREALLACGATANRMQRFDACGGDCVIEISADGQQTRLRANYCGDRWCIPCCRARSLRIAPRLVKMADAKKLRLITLTLARDDRSLRDRLNHLLKSFARLREQKLWSDCIAGGAYVVEFTRGANGDHWHVHLHVLAVGTFIDRRDLSDAWRRASEGSYVVDIRLALDKERAIRYIAKYATKGWGREILSDRDSIQEAIVSLRGRRLISTFGCWRKIDLNEDDRPDVEWKKIGRLEDIAFAASRGEQWATGLMLALHVRVSLAAGRVRFDELAIDPP